MVVSFRKEISRSNSVTFVTVNIAIGAAVSGHVYSCYQMTKT